MPYCHSVLNEVEKNMMKDKEYLRGLLPLNPSLEEMRNFRGILQIMETYTNYSSRNMSHKTLQKHRDKTNVLINVGFRHLPAFECSYFDVSRTSVQRFIKKHFPKY